MSATPTAPQDFDPYHEWLGIPPEQQPPDYYRLLGLNHGEPSAKVIQIAADRQMGYVKGFQTGPRARESQRLLNELASATACLLDPVRKSEYDRSLAPATQLAKRSKPKRKTTNPAVELTKIIFGGAFGMFMAVLLLSYFAGVDLLGWKKPDQGAGGQLQLPAVSQTEQPIAVTKPIAVNMPVDKERPSRQTVARTTRAVNETNPKIDEARTPSNESIPPEKKPIEPITSDPLPAGSVWEGIGTHLRGADVGDQSKVVVEIIERTGESFRGTFEWTNLRSQNMGKYPINGKLVGNRITWEGTNGTVDGGTIKADWDDGASQGNEELKRK